LRVIRTAAQLLRLVLAYALSGLSLRSTAAWAEASGEASFSDVALLKRLRCCGPWLAALAGQLSSAVNPEAACSGSCRRVVAVDATAICSPGGKDKKYRLLHTVYDVGAQRFRTTEVSDRRQAERLDVGTVEAGEIRLGDRAYGRYRDLAAVTSAGADYVVRLSAIALKLTHRDGTAFKRAQVCRTAERDESAGRGRARARQHRRRTAPGPRHHPAAAARQGRGSAPAHAQEGTALGLHGQR
jgi:hypothetical protein